MSRWKEFRRLLEGSSLSDPRDKEKTALHHIEYMLARTQRMFRYENLPDTIPARMLELYLQINGCAAIAEHDGGIYAYTGGLGGEPDEYYQPTVYTIANPAQGWSANLVINTDCVVIRNDSLYLGMMPLFRRYATALTENELSLHVADINSRMVSMISATDDRTIDSARKYLDDIERGKLGVIGDNAFLEGLKAQPLIGASSRGGVLDLMEYEQYLKSSWYNEIGLDSNYNMKRERLNTAEVEMNNDSLAPLVDDMLESRKEGIKRVNEMFNLNIEVTLASAWEQNREEDDLLLGREEEEGGDEDAGMLEDS